MSREDDLEQVLILVPPRGIRVDGEVVEDERGERDKRVRDLLAPGRLASDSSAPAGRRGSPGGETGRKMISRRPSASRREIWLSSCLRYAPRPAVYR